MDSNINLSVVASNRKPISIVGGTLGTQFFKAEARASIPEYEKVKMEIAQAGDIEFCLNRTPRRYRLTGHDILGVNIAQDGTGATKVVLNQGSDSEVSIPIASGMEKIGIVTEDAIGKALRGNTNMIFADAKKLANTLNQYNNDEKTRCLAMIQKLQSCVKQLDSAIAENTKKAETYCNEILNSTPVDVIPGAAPSEGTTIVVKED